MGNRNYGEVFTRRWVADAMLDLVGYAADRDLTKLVAVEPSVGSGAFWLPMVERLLLAADRRGVAAANLGDALRGYDLQQEHVETCISASVAMLVDAGATSEVARQIASRWLRTADYLLDDEDVRADVVLGNPPYIRSDELDPEAECQYRRIYRSMSGRADIYVAFFEKGIAQLKPGGKHAFICADRWMRNAYGTQLRRIVTSMCSVDAVWQMHDADVFSSEVSAYPAITVLTRAGQGSVVIAECNAAFDEGACKRLTRFTLSDATVEHASSFRAHRIARWFSGDDLWPAGDPDSIAMLEELNARLPTIEETGAKVGIGIATGADKAYIVPVEIDVEEDRKLPMIMTGDVRDGTFRWGGSVLLNPWLPDGSLVDLNAFPKLAAQYSSHPELRERYVARKQPGAWFKTIDKVNHALIGQPKLVLQDMKAQITPVYEQGGHYPHHNLYWITAETWDLKVLGGLLLSSVAQSFIEAYCVRMRGGTLRFQSQYLRKIRVPDPSSISHEVAAELASAFERGDREAANRASFRAYGLRADNVAA
ncbi:MAG: SAM-dependent methyltransferase [Actinomycetota bacterium]|nr:MAG: SAM-dependent methyltransferase [Actinomycetota bacterium]